MILTLFLIPRFPLRSLTSFPFSMWKVFYVPPIHVTFLSFRHFSRRRATIDCFFAVASNLRYFLSLLCLCLSLYPDLLFCKFNFQFAFSVVVLSSQHWKLYEIKFWARFCHDLNVLNVAEIKNEFNLRDAIFHREQSQRTRLCKARWSTEKPHVEAVRAFRQAEREKRSEHKSMLKNEFSLAGGARGKGKEKHAREKSLKKSTEEKNFYAFATRLLLLMLCCVSFSSYLFDFSSKWKKNARSRGRRLENK